LVYFFPVLVCYTEKNLATLVCRLKYDMDLGIGTEVAV
jgi:hypothetical protein